MTLSLYQLYQKMLAHMGPTGWWPAETKQQVMVEAILIQNTTEANAVAASQLIGQETGYDFRVIQTLTTSQLENLVRPAGFMKNKAKAIQAVSSWFLAHDQDADAINQRYGAQLRKELLSLHGVGPETADVYLTYVFDQPQFISDKYARTLFGLLGVEAELPTYPSLHRHLSRLPEPFSHQDAKEFHGLIDEFGKAYFHPIENFKTSFLADHKLDWQPEQD